MSLSNAWPPSGVLVAPSLLAADFARFGDEAACAEAAGADWLHLDIMDGHFVPNLSFGPQLLAAIRPACRLPFDVHLMISPVDSYIAGFAEAGADHIIVHAEAGPHLHRSLQLIRSLGKRAGVAINPGTPAAAVQPVLDEVDIVLVMTVNPGFGGQAFIEATLPKIADIRTMIGTRPVVIEVDGGITAATAPSCIEAGASVLVAGTSVFGRSDRAAAIAALRPGQAGGRA